VRRSYKCRIYPNRSQRAALAAQLDFACELYNAALEQRRWAWRTSRRSVSLRDQCLQLTELRAAGLALDGMSAWTQQQVLRQLDHAFRGFFRRVAHGKKAGYPRFKASRRFHTLVFDPTGRGGGAKIGRDARLKLMGIGAVKVKWHRPIPPEAVLSQAYVSRRDGRWYAIFVLRVSTPKPARSAHRPVRIDMGITHFVALSTGELVNGPRAGRGNAARARRAAHSVARRTPGSVRRRKAAALLARQRAKERNRRRDHYHKLARTLVGHFDFIAVEALPIWTLLKRPTGAAPLASKRGLNREIADQGWGTFLRILSYKAEEAGGQIVKVAPQGTSTMCAACGAADRRNRSGEEFRCFTCGHADHADVNAARTILARALLTAARTGPSGANGASRAVA
jgi:putative transposase